MAQQFPNELIEQYKNTTRKLKKFQRIVIKRFGPNLADTSEEFNLLALNFDNSFLPKYAGLCWLANAKCEKALGNPLIEVESLLKSARAFAKADKDLEKIEISSNHHIESGGALRCYNQAITQLEDDSVIKAAIIREIKQLHPTSENLSNFQSPTHRIYDLELAANHSIKNNDFISALEKLTEIYDNINERKVEELYEDVLVRSEISRLFLLLILQLPPSRQSPSHIKLLENYSSICDDIPKGSFQKIGDMLPISLTIELKNLVLACEAIDQELLIETKNMLQQNSIITKEQVYLLEILYKTYIK